MKGLDGFTESSIEFDFREKKADVFLNGGIVVNASDNLNFDAGLNYGITKDSNKIYFIGFSFRY